MYHKNIHKTRRQAGRYECIGYIQIDSSAGQKYAYCNMVREGEICCYVQNIFTFKTI